MAETPLALQDVVEHGPGILSTEVGGELVLMSVETGKYFSLDDIGVQIWRCFETPSSIADALIHLSAGYDAEPGVIERDALLLLSELRAHRLIQLHVQCVAN